ncbi:MAG: hypothetical protein G01um101433_387 [Parcubacteria group bacterium Gr01-1014_33]|nr:MAG: hypothetical protein G01um101433_387 [Parcubacteria group bacterium Gr01-1014_33]
MPSTKLLYLENFSLLECESKVLEILPENEKVTLTLDQTIFYPQGGGQPYDTGIIESANGKFIVEEVRSTDGLVRHIGKLENGNFTKGEEVKCLVDGARRMLHSRIHSAGHLVDWAIEKLGIPWTPDPRGYHYPNGPYVTYNGSLDGLDKEKLKADIEQLCTEAIAKGREVNILFMTKDEMQSICRSIPNNLPEPARVIMFGSDFGVPCGGTHVANLSEIKSVTIRKIKPEGENIRVGYDVL